ncbi:MAG: hypothetical protein GKR90_00240 [Pseudomonadales bacterium]|nr:hypothetical protein [Pseudomonadales bacterium]
MNFKKFALFGLFLSTLPVFASAARVGDFALLDHTGKHHQLSYYSDHAGVVVVAHGLGHSTGIPANVAGTENVAVLYLNALPDETRQAVSEAVTHDAVPVLLDESQMVAESLGLTRVGDAVVIDPANMTIVYRGNVDGLEVALPAAIAGKAVASGQEGGGRAISFASHQSVSYANDIVPILMDNCVSCHQEGGIGSWAMDSHAMVQGWSAMMREVVLARRMPPGQIDNHVGRAIKDVAGLSNKEMRKLVRWIDAGAPMDAEAQDPLASVTFSKEKFTLGEPDLVYKVAAQEIPATGIVDYRYVPVQLDLDKDVWVRAMEFVPGDRSVLHHVIAYVSSPADKTVRGRQTGAARGESVGGFAPGRQPDQFWDNSGRLIKKGSSLLLQMHYTTAGREAVDETEIGIYLHDKPPAFVMSGGVAGQRRFLVPPHEKEYPLEGVQEIERDAYLYELNPHMHFRGKYMNYTAEYPDGTSETLLSVPKYDFNWQFNYVLEEPLFLPAGTKLIAKGAMDNSAQNPGNPDPSKPVHFGLQTMHEMFFGFTTLRYVGDTPASIVAVDKEGSENPGAE